MGLLGGSRSREASGTSSLSGLTQRLHQPTLHDTLGRIEPQQSRGHLANGSYRLDDRPLKLEVPVPRVSPGIEEPDRPAGAIYRCVVCPLVPIAEDAGVGQIFYLRGSAVFPADDVIDLVRKASAILMRQTVFETSTGALDDKTAHGVVYITSHWSRSAGRALWPSGGYVPDP